MTQAPQKPGNDDLGAYVGLVLLLVVGGGFFGFLGMVTNPDFMFVPVAVCLFGFVLMFHYLLWGRLLSRVHRDGEAESETEDAE